MPLIRTAKGFQWTDGPVRSSPIPAITPSSQVPAITPSVPAASDRSVKSLLNGSKELLPWILAACQVVSWFGVKYLTSDRMQQQQIDDHVALAEVRTQLAQLQASESQLSGKLDVLLTLNYKGR